ncbi:hypothetical protein [Kocuria aegyptia]|uniref:Uncharacterized protein n=1 Tax=Kocuria aegyptia TaxID=330943 RepID=A0ABN2K4L6_9MICC
MGQDKQLRGYLVAMLAGAGIMVLALVAGWPPGGRLEVLFAWFTAGATVVAVSLTLYEWRQARRRREQDGRP